MIRWLFLPWLIVLMGCANTPEQAVRDDRVHIGPAIALKDVLRIEAATFLESNSEQNLVLPSKIQKWNDRFIYQTSDTYMINTYLIMFDTAWNYVGRVEPISGAPGFVREVTDFFVYQNVLHVYDFQSQKFVLYDKQLNVVGERRTPYYYRNFAVFNAKVIAYSGKVLQFSEGKEWAFDLMELDTGLAPVKYWRPFRKEKYDGVVFHTPKPLVANAHGLYYSEWWNDTLFNVDLAKAEVQPWLIFEYEERSLPKEVYAMSHPEVYQHILLGEYTGFVKGASPAFLTDKQMIFSYGNGDRLGYGIYDLESKVSRVFSDYEYSLDERLLTPKYNEGDSFFSVVYPYELIDYMANGLVSRESFEKAFLARLEQEPADGRPILLQYQIVLSDK